MEQAERSAATAVDEHKQVFGCHLSKATVLIDKLFS
jgi:hypothetical protein